MIGDQAQWYLEQGPTATFETGFRNLDLVTGGGLRAGDISVIGAATGGGKSAFGEQLALNVSKSVADGTRQTFVMYFSLEMSAKQSITRMVAKLDRCSVAEVERNGLSLATRSLLNGRSLWVREAPNPIAFGVTALMQAIGEQPYVDVVIVDHVRHIDGWLGKDGSHASSSSIVRRLRQFAQDQGIHIVLLCQLNRMGYGKRPQLQNLQDTSSLEQLASLVVLLHRPFQYKGKRNDYVTELLIPKNRYGPCCKLHYRWVPETMSLWPFDEEDEARLTCCGPRSGDANA